MECGLDQRRLGPDDEHPYTEKSRFDWIRGYHVGGRSITWGRQSYRHSDLDFEANALGFAPIATGVDSAGQRDALLEIGFRYGLGDLYATTTSQNITVARQA